MAAPEDHHRVGDLPPVSSANATSATPPSLVEPIYAQWAERVAVGRERLGRPLTFAEKVLVNHLRHPRQPGLEARAQLRGLRSRPGCPPRRPRPDRGSAVHDGRPGSRSRCRPPSTAITSSRPRWPPRSTSRSALDLNAEVYDFLRAVCARFGIGFWKPGSGIIHQVVLENYAFPGGMMIGTDSHTPNAGGLGMVAIGVGGGDAIDVMTGQAFNVRWPTLIGVHLTGSLSGWTSPKDVILKVAELLTVTGGTGAIVEYFGPGADTISATGKATICNMGAEVGATTSLFPFDANIAAIPGCHRARGTGRARRRDRRRPACRSRGRGRPRPISSTRSSRSTSSALTPMINGPDTPDLAHRVSEVGAWARHNGVPSEISAALVGSCTNSSYEDMTRAASIARQASAYGLRAKTPLLVTPGSEQVRATIERDGLLADLEAIGATVLANACGPCIGQWDRSNDDPDKINTIVNSFNRNFPKRNDGNANTKAFVTSPEMVVAYALAGTLDFDPLTDSITDRRRGACAARPPGRRGAPAARLRSRRVRLRGTPSRQIGNADRGVAHLGPAATPGPVPGLGRQGLRRPARAAQGEGQMHDRPHLGCRCVAPLPGPPREHLRQPVPRGDQRIHGRHRRGEGSISTARLGPFAEIAKHLARSGTRWCAVGDENYGEGSSREHAAMEPRYRGGLVILARSFARIHETNLKKQGLLPLTFADPTTYDLIGENDRLSVLDLASLAPDAPVRCRVAKAEGDGFEFSCTHTFSSEQIEWFRAGSALNVIRRRGSPEGSLPS